MTARFMRRLKAYKELLRKRIRARQGVAFKVKLERPLAKEFASYVADFHPGVVATNPARDIRELVSPGPKFDAEFAFLYHGQLCPQFIEDYSETYLAKLVKRCVTPDDVELGLRRRGDGKPVWEEV